MQQMSPIDTLHSVLWRVVQALGGPKKVGVRMRPEKTQKEAEHWIYNSLNKARRERMGPEHVLWLLREGKKSGHHEAMEYFCQASGYLPAQPEDADRELEDLRRQHAEASERVRQIEEKLAKLDRAAP